jgi:DNA-binding beta-propeller fold protein YncE/cytochrome c peroxidase
MRPTCTHALLLAGFLSLPAGALASNCTWKPSPVDTIGASVRLELECDPGGISYRWDFGDGAADTTATPSVRHTFSRQGQFIVVARVLEGDSSETPLVGGQTIIHPVTPGKPTNASTLLFDAGRSRLWTVNPDNGSVVYIDWPSQSRSPEIPVGRKPRGIAQDAQGNIWVCNQESASLSILDPGTGRLIETLALPRASRPFGIAMDMKRNWAYVTLQATGKLVKIDAAQRRVLAALDVVPGARGLAISHDGSRIFVTRFVSAREDGEIAEVNGGGFTVARRFPIAYDRSPDTDLSGSGVPNALNSVVITPDGRQAWFTAKKDNTHRGVFNDGRAFNEENTVRTFFGALDLQTNAEIVSRRTDLDNRGTAHAVTFTSNGAYAFVATLTSNTIDIYNAAGNLRTGSIDPQKLTQELAPQGLLVHPNDSVLFVQYFTSREIGAYDLSALGKSNEVPLISLIKTVDRDSLGAQAAFGQRVFYNSSDPRMTRSFYISCATCHMDGMSDERVWDFTERGEGLRNTTTLLGKGGTGTGPLHWSANFDEVQDFEHDIRGPQRGYGFLPDDVFNQGTRNQALGDPKAGLSPELDALAAYLKTLSKVPPSPYRNPDGSMTSEALEGKAVFQRPEVGCAKCHAGAGFTDSDLEPDADLSRYVPFHAVKASPGGFVLHDVGTLKPSSGHRLNDTLPGFDTPPLKGLWATAPYLHDGSAATLMDVIDSLNPSDKHGRTSQLTRQEKEKLVAYLMQLDDGDANTGAIEPSPGGALPGIRLTLARVGGGIEFRVPGATPPELRVSDASGRLVFRVFDRNEWNASPAGWVVRWRPADRHGRSLSNGIYMAQAVLGAGHASLRFPIVAGD